MNCFCICCVSKQLVRVHSLSCLVQLRFGFAQQWSSFESLASGLDRVFSILFKKMSELNLNLAGVATVDQMSREWYLKDVVFVIPSCRALLATDGWMS